MRDLIFALAYGFVDSAFAMTPAQAENEFSGELAWCGAYYTIGAVGGELAGVKGALAKEQPIIDRALEMSRRYSSAAQVQARYELSLKEETKVYKSDGMSRLILQYADSCKLAIEHLEVRLQQLRSTS